MTGPAVDVSVIVPNYNGLSLIERYLGSVVAAIEEHPRTELWLVDDGSTDRSIELVRRAFPSVQVIQRPANGGFGEACNTGVQAARGDILVFVMTDLEVTHDFLAPLVAHFDDPTVFAVGARIAQAREDPGNAGITRLVLSRGMFHTDWPGTRPGYEGNGHALDVSFAVGGAMACDRRKFLELGGFDPIFAPYYWEDIDLSYRARKRGWRVLCEPRSLVYHPEAHAVIRQLPPSSRAGETACRNELLFTWLNLHDRRLLAAHGAWLALRLLRRACRCDGAYWRAFLGAARRLPAVFRGRRVRRAEAQQSDRELLALPSDREKMPR